MPGGLLQAGRCRWACSRGGNGGSEWARGPSSPAPVHHPSLSPRLLPPPPLSPSLLISIFRLPSPHSCSATSAATRYTRPAAAGRGAELEVQVGHAGGAAPVPRSRRRHRCRAGRQCAGRRCCARAAYCSLTGNSKATSWPVSRLYTLAKVSVWSAGRRCGSGAAGSVGGQGRQSCALARHSGSTAADGRNHTTVNSTHVVHPTIKSTNCNHY